MTFNLSTGRAILLAIGILGGVFAPASSIRAEPALNIAQSLVLMSNEATHSCGTGIILDENSILTAGHLAHGICPVNSCEPIQIRAASRIGEPTSLQISTGKITLSRYNPILDLAILQSELPLTSAEHARHPLPNKFMPAILSQSVTLFGFARCNELHESSGEVELALPLEVTTTAKGFFGSSGGLIMAGDVPVGVIQQGASIWQTFSGRLLNRNFSLGGISGDVINTFISHRDGQEFASCAPYLPTLTEHLARLHSLDGLARIRSASRAISTFDEIPLCLPAGFNLAPLSVLLSGPAALWSYQIHSETGEAESLERAALSAALEENGLPKMLKTPNERTDAYKLLTSQGRTQQQSEAIQKIIEEFVSSGFDGQNPTLVKYVISGATLIGILLFVWVASAGYVYGLAQGTRSRRLIKALLTLILAWPVSLAIFIFLRRYRARQTAKRSKSASSKTD